MTATERLRRMLDERGVEWDADDEIMDDGSISQVTYWYSNGIDWSTDGRDEYLAFDAVQLITPEQAIVATLGPADPRERGLIPHFWTGDWTLHIEAARLPERIDLALPDQRGREVHSARVHRFVPERTCHDKNGFDPKTGFECTECRAMTDGYMVTLEDMGHDVPFRFCPNCGRRVV